MYHSVFIFINHLWKPGGAILEITSDIALEIISEFMSEVKKESYYSIS